MVTSTVLADPDASRRGHRPGSSYRVLTVMLVPLLVGAVGGSSAQEQQPAKNLARVKAITALSSGVALKVRLTGEIEARTETSIAFRISGKVIERQANVGDHVTADQVVATLDTQENEADLQTAEATLKSAQAVLQQSQVNFDRQKSLLKTGFTTQANFDLAQATLQTAKSQVEAANAALATTREQKSYTQLRAGVDGIVVSRQVEVGQVVEAGQTIFTIAEDGPRDAVFNVYEALLLRPPQEKGGIEITLQSDPSVKTVGLVREISPTVDPVSGTVKVKIGLSQTPERMTLGASVVGHGQLAAQTVVALPWGALFEWQGKPAVWVIDAKGAVSPRAVTVERYLTGSVVLSQGIEPGEHVVTDGVQYLRPSQSVEVAEDQP